MSNSLLAIMTNLEALVKTSQLGLLSVLVGGLVSCSNFAKSGFGVTNIRDLPQNNQDSTVTVYLKGKVINLAPFLGSGAYQLQDKTGKIWVITTQTLPSQGDQVLIAAKLQNMSIPLSGKDFGEVYVQEEQQLERKTNPQK